MVKDLAGLVWTGTLLMNFTDGLMKLGDEVSRVRFQAVANRAILFTISKVIERGDVAFV